MQLQNSQGGERDRSLATSFHRARQKHVSRNRPSSSVNTNFSPAQSGSRRRPRHRGHVVPLGRGEEVALGDNLDLCSLHQEPAGRVGLEPGGRDGVVVPRQKGVFRIGTDDAAHLARFLR